MTDSNDSNSPSFRRRQAEQRVGLREFNVGVPDDVEPSYPVRGYQAEEISPSERDHLQRVRKEEMARGPKITDGAKKRIEILANIGRLTKDVEMDGVTFSLRTLKNKETRETTLSIFEARNDADASFELRKQTLARALFKIDGRDIDEVLGGYEIERVLQFIDDLEEIVVNRLYNEFNSLRQEVLTKYGLNSEKDVKEVLDNVKK